LKKKRESINHGSLLIDGAVQNADKLPPDSKESAGLPRLNRGTAGILVGHPPAFQYGLVNIRQVSVMVIKHRIPASKLL
jgi:hypothetical protein